MKYIISNDCSCYPYYKDVLDVPYPHPFISNSISIENYIKIIKNFHNLNLMDYDISEKPTTFLPTNNTHPYIHLNQIDADVFFIHYSLPNAMHHWPQRANRFMAIKDTIPSRDIMFIYNHLCSEDHLWHLTEDMKNACKDNGYKLVILSKNNRNDSIVTEDFLYPNDIPTKPSLVIKSLMESYPQFMNFKI